MIKISGNEVIVEQDSKKDYNKFLWEVLDLMSNKFTILAFNKKKSKFTDAEITTALLAGVPKAGIVIVEMWYSYHQELALPWITPFVPDPIQLYMSSVAPLPAAAPPEPTPTP